jgi:plasmid stabilization system protein ParE
VSLLVILDPEAQAEFDEGYDFYEGRRSGLGERFADAVQVTLERIAELPQLHSVMFGNVRKAVLKGFPYSVYYRVETSQVRVLAVFHTSRDPNIWQSRAEPIDGPESQDRTPRTPVDGD